LRSYALEVLAVHANGRAPARHPRAIFLETLKWIGESELGEPAYVTDYVRASEFRSPRNSAWAFIYDPAVSGNNVADNLSGADRRSAVAAAKQSAKRLAQAERALSDDRVRDGKVLIREALGLRRT
jgi:hypothetical protein